MPGRGPAANHRRDAFTLLGASIDHCHANGRIRCFVLHVYEEPANSGPVSYTYAASLI